MVTRRDFLKTMTMASAGLAAGAGEILNAQTLSSSKNKNEKVKIAYVGMPCESPDICKRSEKFFG